MRSSVSRHTGTDCGTHSASLHRPADTCVLPAPEDLYVYSKKLFCLPFLCLLLMSMYSCMIVYIYALFVNIFLIKTRQKGGGTIRPRLPAVKHQYSFLSNAARFISYRITRTFRTPSIAFSFSATESSTFLSRSEERRV